MKRILVVNPNTSPAVTDKIRRAAVAASRRDTLVEVVMAAYGPESIEGEVDEVIAAHAVVESIARLSPGYDAAVIACFSDPGLRAAREACRQPVVGIAESSLLLAHGTGLPFSLLSNMPEDEAVFRRLARSLGLDPHLRGVHATGFPVAAFGGGDREALSALDSTARRAVQEGARLLCLACAGMSGLSAPLAAITGVPVLDGVACGVKMAELRLDLGLLQPEGGPFRRGQPRRYVAGFGSALERLYDGDR
ncbi:MAG: aspartate/glutamate racemase family protein [bacterium]|nr:aspartate/glutamate racemase family protein [bacterium]